VFGRGYGILKAYVECPAKNYNAAYGTFYDAIKKKRSKQTVSRILFPCAVTHTETTIIHLGHRLPGISCDLPGSMGGQPLALPYLVLHRVGFTKLPRSPGELVRSYRTVSPLPRTHVTSRFIPEGELSAGRSTFCCTFLHVAMTPRYGAPCPAVFGLSSRPFTARRSFVLLRPKTHFHCMNKRVLIPFCDQGETVPRGWPLCLPVVRSHLECKIELAPRISLESCQFPL